MESAAMTQTVIRRRRGIGVVIDRESSDAIRTLFSSRGQLKSPIRYTAPSQSAGLRTESQILSPDHWPEFSAAIDQKGCSGVEVLAKKAMSAHQKE